jgi:hypothetical protein
LIIQGTILNKSVSIKEMIYEFVVSSTGNVYLS